MGTMKNNKTLTIITSNMKTKYLIPQTEAMQVLGDKLMQGFGGTTGIGEPGTGNAPARGGFAPGGGDLGGVPAN